MSLSERQHQLISLAITTGGNITSHLSVLKGGAKMNMIRSLQAQGLVVQQQNQWLITDSAKAAVSQPINPLRDRFKSHGISERHYALLSHAASDPHDRIAPYLKAKGGAKLNVLRYLSDQGWIEQANGAWLITQKAKALLTRINQASPSFTKTPNTTAQTAPVTVAVRENSKIALLISLLSHPSGVSMDQLCQATGWQAHTVRGCFSNTLKKKLNLNLASHRGAGEDRLYRIDAS